jgi:dTDP-4-amino-4,6-dideoxygalactose transaminase
VDLRAQTRNLRPAIRAAVDRVLDRGDFILGEELERFETEFAAYCGVGHAVGVDSGFSAIELALRAVGIGQGDEVITQANSYIATVGAILAVGARPVLVDCDRFGSIDPAAVVAAVTPRTQAIIPVHMFGRVCDIDSIASLAASRGIAMIEDACQAHGATWLGKRAGSFGIAGAFSFYPSKNLGAIGDGGMVVTNSGWVADAIRLLRNYGQREKSVHSARPFNHRLDTLQAAVLRAKLPHLDRWNERRRQRARAYRAQLAGAAVGFAPADAPGRHVYHLFVIEADRRDRLRAELTDAGIETGIHYPVPLHRQPALLGLGYRAGAFPWAEFLAAHSISLPMFPELPISHVERVTAEIRRLA